MKLKEASAVLGIEASAEIAEVEGVHGKLVNTLEKQLTGYSPGSAKRHDALRLLAEYDVALHTFRQSGVLAKHGEREGAVGGLANGKGSLAETASHPTSIERFYKNEFGARSKSKVELNHETKVDQHQATTRHDQHSHGVDASDAIPASEQEIKRGSAFMGSVSRKRIVGLAMLGVGALACVVLVFVLRAGAKDDRPGVVTPLANQQKVLEHKGDTSLKVDDAQNSVAEVDAEKEIEIDSTAKPASVTNAVSEVDESSSITMQSDWLQAQTDLRHAYEQLSLVAASTKSSITPLQKAYLRELREQQEQAFPFEDKQIVQQKKLTAYLALAASAKQRVDDLPKVKIADVAQMRLYNTVEKMMSEGLGQWPLTVASIEQFESLTIADINSINAALDRADRFYIAGQYGEAAQHYNGIVDTVSGLQLKQDDSLAQLQKQIDALFASGEEAVKRQRLSVPADKSALYYLKEIKRLNADAPQYQQLRDLIGDAYLGLARAAQSKGNFERAKIMIKRRAAILNGGDRSSLLASLEENKRRYINERFKSGEVISEVRGLPMVSVPMGEFLMGNKSNALNSFFAGLFGDKYNASRERPAHKVVIDQPFAVAQHEVTVELFGRFVKETAYVTDAEKKGQSNALFSDKVVTVKGKNWRHDYLGNAATPDAPVIHVSFDDAGAFVAWLSEKTGASYRLPSESEFEYVARQGQSSLSPWGDGKPGLNDGNFRRAKDQLPDGWTAAKGKKLVKTVAGASDGYFGPAPVGKYSANGFKVNDAMGNVSEWTADCYSANYKGKTSAQQARTEANCDLMVVRGVSWASDERLLRASYRLDKPRKYTANTVGFRVVRDL